MKNTMKRLLTTLVIFALVFTCIPAISGTLEADAAAKPSPVNSINLKAYGMHEITVSWGKAKKNYNGYTIYRDGKVLKHVGKSVKSYKDLGLKPDTKYSYYVRAYRNVKQKQWFNKKTGKWQTKKPAKKIRGKSRKVTVKLYGRSSPKQSIRTGKPSENFSESTQNNYQGPGLFYKWTSESITIEMDGGEPDSKVTITSPGLPTVELNQSKKSYTYVDLKPATDYVFTIKRFYGGKDTDPIVRTVTTNQRFDISGVWLENTIELKWTDMNDAVEYKVIGECDGVVIVEEVVKTNTYKLTSADKTKTYKFHVEIKKKDGTWTGTREIEIKPVGQNNN